MRYFLIFFILIFASCSGSYQEYFDAEHPEIFSGVVSSGSSSLEFTGNGTISAFPDKNGANMVANMLRASESQIRIMIYTWTNVSEIFEALETARAHSVDIRVLLEDNVYGSPTINRPTIHKLTALDIPIAYTDHERYTFTHAKYWIVDDAYCISTGNWTLSFFTKNQEYMYCDHDAPTRTILEEMFEKDSAGLAYKDPSKIPAHLVISPVDGRAKIESLLRSAEHELLIYTQTLEDPAMIDILRERQESGVRVRICTADNETNTRMRERFGELNWKIQKNPYLHAKILIRDNETFYLGSHNLSTNSLDNNREVGILLPLRDPDKTRFEADYTKGCTK